MTMQSTKIVSAVERVQNSVNGNPRYKISFTDSTSYRTEPDKDFNSQIHNEYDGRDLVGRTVVLGVSRKNRILTLDVLQFSCLAKGCPGDHAGFHQTCADTKASVGVYA